MTTRDISKGGFRHGKNGKFPVILFPVILFLAREIGREISRNYIFGTGKRKISRSVPLILFLPIKAFLDIFWNAFYFELWGLFFVKRASKIL